jgi:hypothetical protein
VTNQNPQITVYDGSLSVNNNYKRVIAGVLPVIPEQFTEKVYIEVEQLSLSTSVFNFWKLVQSQQTGASSLFQPASVKIKGNVHSTSDPSEEVLGIFGVSSIVTKSIFILRDDIPAQLQPLRPFVTDDCRVLNPSNSTTVRPPFW